MGLDASCKAYLTLSVKYFATALVHGAEPPHRGRPQRPRCSIASRRRSSVRGRIPSGHGGARAHDRRPEPGPARAPVPARALPAPTGRTLERIGGHPGAVRPSSYIGLWSRLEGFELADLTRALERRKVVQGTLLRSTIHLVSAGDYWAFAIGTQAARQEAWLRFDKKRLSRSDLTSAAKAVRKASPARCCTATSFSTSRASATPSGRPISGTASRLDRARARPAFRDVGAAPRRPLRPRRRVARAADRDARGERRDPPTPVPDRLRAGAPRRRRELGRPRPGDVQEAAEGIRLRRFRDEEDRELVDLPRAPLPGGPTPLRRGSCPPGTRRFSSMRAERRSCRSTSGRSSSTRRRRTPRRRSSSTAPWQASGPSRQGKKATLVLDPFERAPGRREARAPAGRRAARALRRAGRRDATRRMTKPDTRLCRPDVRRLSRFEKSAIVAI